MQDLEKLKKIIEKSGDGYYKIKVRNGKYFMKKISC